MNLEHICYGCFQEKPDDSLSAPTAGLMRRRSSRFWRCPWAHC